MEDEEDDMTGRFVEIPDGIRLASTRRTDNYMIQLRLAVA